MVTAPLPFSIVSPPVFPVTPFLDPHLAVDPPQKNSEQLPAYISYEKITDRKYPLQTVSQEPVVHEPISSHVAPLSVASSNDSKLTNEPNNWHTSIETSQTSESLLLPSEHAPQPPLPAESAPAPPSYAPPAIPALVLFTSETSQKQGNSISRPTSSAIPPSPSELHETGEQILSVPPSQSKISEKAHSTPTVISQKITSNESSELYDAISALLSPQEYNSDMFGTEAIKEPVPPSNPAGNVPVTSSNIYATSDPILLAPPANQPRMSTSEGNEQQNSKQSDLGDAMSTLLAPLSEYNSDSYNLDLLLSAKAPIESRIPTENVTNTNTSIQSQIPSIEPPPCAPSHLIPPTSLNVNATHKASETPDDNSGSSYPDFCISSKVPLSATIPTTNTTTQKQQENFTAPVLTKSTDENNPAQLTLAIDEFINLREKSAAIPMQLQQSKLLELRESFAVPELPKYQQALISTELAHKPSVAPISAQTTLYNQEDTVVEPAPTTGKLAAPTSFHSSVSSTVSQEFQRPKKVLPGTSVAKQDPYKQSSRLQTEITIERASCASEVQKSTQVYGTMKPTASLKLEEPDLKSHRRRASETSVELLMSSYRVIFLLFCYDTRRPLNLLVYQVAARCLLFQGFILCIHSSQLIVQLAP